jgi:hypothetical protein
MPPILLNSCALATTAEEAAYRIDAPIAPRRGARVVALDDAAATVVRRVAREPWNNARFFTLVVGASSAEGAGPLVSPTIGEDGSDIPLRRTDGTNTRLTDELSDADVAVMVATTDGSAAAADAIGRACYRRGIMTAGIVLGGQLEVRNTLVALRPHAQVLLVTRDEADVAEVLTALRA